MAPKTRAQPLGALNFIHLGCASYDDNVHLGQCFGKGGDGVVVVSLLGDTGQVQVRCSSTNHEHFCISVDQDLSHCLFVRCHGIGVEA